MEQKNMENKKYNYDTYRAYMEELLKRNKHLHDIARASYDSNPEGLLPSPRLREIIERYVDKEVQQKYTDIAIKWQNGTLTTEELYEKYFGVIKFFMDWNTLWAERYMVNFAYGYISSFVEIWRNMTKSCPELDTHIVSSAYKFTEEEAEYILNHWEEYEKSYHAAFGKEDEES